MNPHFVTDYRKLFRDLRSVYDEDSAMSAAVGGHYQAIGAIERALLIHAGLKPEHRLIDVGCGSGRLAVQLADYLTGDYLGTDVVPELLAYAQRQCPDHWRFELVEGLILPVADNWADCICFFSVLTHLRHEESYCYLSDAVRALRPGGRLVISFLEYASNWDVFESTVAVVRAGHALPHLNVFIGRDAVDLWCRRLNLELVAIHGGHDHFIPLPHPVNFEGNGMMESPGALGQSVAIAVKR